MSEFSELFKRLLADRSTSSFAKETRTSQPAVYRAVHGGSIVVAHLEKWADGLGLTGDSRRQFIEAGKAEKAVKYKHSGPLARDAYARMERQNALLSRLIVVLLKDPHKLSQEARTLLEQLKEAL